MRPHGASLRAMLVDQGAKPGSLAFKPWEMPDPAALDAEYFDDDPKRFVQMRPVLRHEQVPGRSLALPIGSSRRQHRQSFRSARSFA